jgi:hypothetical protein
VGAVIVAQRLALAAVDMIDRSPFSESFVWTASQPPSFALVSPLARMLLTCLPFVIGYFLGLWLVAPIAEELRVGHVITRAVLATGIGATLWFIAVAVAGVILVMVPSLGDLAISGFASVPVQLGYALEDALSGFIGLLPLGVLSGVLLWLWRKDHAPRHPLSGLIDEV